jgi:hypothetical protein
MQSQVDNSVKIKVHAISDVEGMKRIEHLYDAFISEHGGGPFLFSGFISQFLGPNSFNSRPCILVFSIDNKIIGVAPLAIREDLFHRKCDFLMDPLFPSAFIFDPRYERALFRETFTIMYRNMGCLFFDVTYPAKSQHLSVLKEVCGELGISFLSIPFKGSAILPVKGSWTQFEKSRSWNLRHKLKRTERRMREMGQFNIEWFGKGADKAEVLKRISAVEKASWKNLNQPPEKFELNPHILVLLNGCIQTSLTVPAFNWGVAILELNGTAIAHSMFLEYNGYAYIYRTSFDDRYRRLGPGIYTINAVVRELMSKTEVKVIDFVTDLPFEHQWASEVVPVNRVIISRNHLGLLYLIRVFLLAGIHEPRVSFDQALNLYRRATIKANN